MVTTKTKVKRETATDEPDENKMRPPHSLATLLRRWPPPRMMTTQTKLTTHNSNSQLL